MTLLEVLIGVFILILITASLAQATWLTTRGKRSIEEREEVLHTARVALQKMRRDLEMAYVVQPKLSATGQDLSPYQTGLIAKDGGTEDSIDFSTFAGQRFLSGVAAADQREVGYHVEPLADADREGHNYPSAAKQLLRREDLMPDQKLTEGGESLVLLPAFLKFNLEFWDPKEGTWATEWDSTNRSRQNQLPRAVRITVELPDPRGGERSPVAFQSVALLGLGPDPIPAVALTTPTAAATTTTTTTTTTGPATASSGGTTGTSSGTATGTGSSSGGAP